MEFLNFMKVIREHLGESSHNEETQKLETKAQNLETRIIRRVLEYFKLAKAYINSLSHEDAVNLFCEYFKVGPTTNLHDALEVKTVGALYEAAQRRDIVMQSAG